MEDESSSSLQAKLLSILFSRCSENLHSCSWILFACSCDQVISQMTNPDYTTIFKLILFHSVFIRHIRSRLMMLTSSFIIESLVHPSLAWFTWLLFSQLFSINSIVHLKHASPSLCIFLLRLPTRSSILSGITSWTSRCITAWTFNLKILNVINLTVTVFPQSNG